MNAANTTTAANSIANATRRANGMTGGKRGKRKGGKSRKLGKKASNWNKLVMEVYRELKKKNPATKLGDAMREAARRKRD